MIVPVIVVLAVVAALVAVKVGSAKHTVQPAQQSQLASAAVVSEVTSVPTATFNAVGAGSIATAPKAIQGPELTAGGKPRLLYVGAEFCPYCAAERWALVAALARFGTFSSLGQTFSSPTDVYPNTATLSFHGSTYTSGVLSFTGAELQSNQQVGGQYTPLDSLDPADMQLFQSLGGNSYPFVDIAGRYVITGASYNPAILQGKTQAQIAATLSDPRSPIAAAVDGTANVITAALCSVTANQPTPVCTSPGVVAARAKLTSGG